jgi:tetratricopeptide (TPR) repeat protein
VTGRRLRGLPGALRAVLLGALVLPLGAGVHDPAAAFGADPPRETRPPASDRAPGGELQQKLEAALELYGARRFAEAREAFLAALAAMPAEDGRVNLEYDIAACDYELGRFAEAERRFERVAQLDASVRGDALLHAGWAALGAGDLDAAERHLGAVADDAPEAQRSELRAAIEATRRERASAELDAALEKAAAAYDRGDLTAAEAALGAARGRASAGTSRSQATLEYLTALVAHERGDEALARQALARCLQHDPEDGAAHVLLGELSRRDGDARDAERHYRASLATDLPPADAELVRQALDSLYGLPPPGLDAWAVLGAGYDSNATQSGSTETLGYAAPGSASSAFGAPAWGLEYRLASSGGSRLGVYYSGDWLMLGNPEVEDFSVQSHEAGLRFYLALSRAVDLRLVAAGGATFSGLELSPFSLDSLVGGRLSVQHGRRFESVLSVEARPSLGLSGQDYLSGVRSEVSVGERFASGRWSAALSVGYRHAAVGTEAVDLDPTRFPRCNLACAGASYRIPLGYAGPVIGGGLELALTDAISLGVNGKYEHRTYLEPSRIEGPVLPNVLAELSEKTRNDDRYTLGGRARYELGAAPAIGLFLDYSLRFSRSNVAFQLGDIEHAFDYDDRNFTQHLVELGADLRL